MKEKRSRKELSQKSVPKNPNKGVLCPKIDTAERRRQSGKNPRLGKSLNFKGTVSFLHIRGIKRYFPTAPLLHGLLVPAELHSKNTKILAVTSAYEIKQTR